MSPVIKLWFYIVLKNYIYWNYVYLTVSLIFISITALLLSMNGWWKVCMSFMLKLAAGTNEMNAEYFIKENKENGSDYNYLKY